MNKWITHILVLEESLLQSLLQALVPKQYFPQTIPMPYRADEKRVCWLSPSEYIFQTQIKNWNAALNIPDFTTKEKEHKIAGQLCKTNADSSIRISFA